MTQLTIITAIQALRTAGNRAVIVRVISSDDNSGVGEIQMSHLAGFTTYQSFLPTGATTNLPWSLQPSGWVYVRVRDQAGNLSAMSDAHGPAEYKVFLPAALK